jgi:hypothetical protein
MASILPNQLPPSSETETTPLPKALGTNLPAYPIGEDRNKVVETINAYKESNKRLADMAAEQEVNKAKAYKQYIDPIVTKYEQDSKEYKEKLAKFDGVDNAFHPTQENIPAMASIFSAVGILGSLFGGGARNSGMNALSSMTGMMEGWQKGDVEKFKQEKAAFDENRLQQRQEIDSIMKRWEQVAKEYVTNKEKAKADADVLIAQQGSAFIAETYRNKGLKETLDMIFKLKKSDDDTQAHIDNVELKKLAIETKKTGRSASDRYGFGDIVASASNEAAAAIKAIMGLPMVSTSGIFGGRSTTSLFTAPVDAMANKITSETAQRYNVESGKLGYSLAQLMSGGRAVRVSDVAQMNNILSVKEGDKLETVATKLAEARQLAERTMEVRARSSSTDPGLKEVFKENLELVQQVVPFTVNDINKFVVSRDKSITFLDALSNKYVEPQKYSDPEKEARYQKWLKENPQ